MTCFYQLHVVEQSPLVTLVLLDGSLHTLDHVFLLEEWAGCSQPLDRPALVGFIVLRAVLEWARCLVKQLLDFAQAFLARAVDSLRGVGNFDVPC